MENKVLPNDVVKIRLLDDGQYLLEHPKTVETSSGETFHGGVYSVCLKSFRSLTKRLKEIFDE